MRGYLIKHPSYAHNFVKQQFNNTSCRPLNQPTDNQNVTNLQIVFKESFPKVRTKEIYCKYTESFASPAIWPYHFRLTFADFRAPLKGDFMSDVCILDK